MRSALSATTLALWLLISCQRGTAAPPSEVEATAISDTLRALAIRIQNQTNGRDVNAQMQIWAEDPQVTFSSDTTIFTGAESIRALLSAAYSGFAMMDFRWDTLRIAVLSRDAGAVTGSGHARYTTVGGVTDSMTVTGTYAFGRRGDAWRLLHGHASHAPMAR